MSPGEDWVQGGAAPGGAATMGESRGRRLVTITLVTVAFGLLLAAVLALVLTPGWYPNDGTTYLAAGERLNAGHELYRLLPGDRPMATRPPYITVPLLSPPPIAVFWRPLALVGEPAVWIWWLGSATSVILALAALALRRPLVTAACVAPLVVPLAFAIGWGNVDGYFLAGLVLMWILARGGHGLSAGVIAAAMVAVKLTPLPLAVWLVVAGIRRGPTGFAVAGAAIAAISVAGAGLDAHVEYLGIIRHTGTVGASELSLAGIARALGVPDVAATLAPVVLWTACAILMVALRRRPGAAFAVAVVWMVAGSPAVQPYTFTLLLAALAPIAWPWNGRSAGARAGGSLVPAAAGQSLRT